MRSFATAFAFLPLLLLVLQSSTATTWLVLHDGSGDAPTIQAAVDSTSPGDEILVGPGTYGEEITLPHGLTLRSQLGADVTSIDAEGARAHCVRTTGEFTGSGAIEGFTFTGVNSGYGFCTGVSSLSLGGCFSITDCVVTNNFCADGKAPVEGGGGCLMLTNTQFTDNGAGYSCGMPDPGNGSVILWSGFLLAIGCTFEENSGSTHTLLELRSGDATFESCQFVGNATVYGLGMFGIFDGSLSISNSLFVDHADMSFLDETSTPLQVVLTGNTFARNTEYFSLGVPPIPSGSHVRRNVFTGSAVGLSLPNNGAGITVDCNDSWGNTVNWEGFDPGIGSGNISAPPLYCDSENNDFTLAENSPLLPEVSPCGALIGAFGEGCGSISIEETSWAKIKAKYR
jgi:hypothetical protein